LRTISVVATRYCCAQHRQAGSSFKD